MNKIVVIGGGWAGCAAAIRAKKAGAEVVLLEKTDLLLGLGNVGGIMRNNGRYTATEENICLGADELFNITDKFSLHQIVDFPGHGHASFYDVSMVEPAVRTLLKEIGINIMFMTRAVDGERDSESGSRSESESGRHMTSLSAVKTGQKSWEKAEIIHLEGDMFIETTGSAGPMGNCTKYGNGCSMCVLRCPAFGPRVSITEKVGLCDYRGERADGTPGAFSGSCKLEKRTLSKKLQKKLEKDGYAVIPLPEAMIHKEKLSQKVCQQYALDQFAENLILIDTGYAKLMTSYFDLTELRKVPGFKNARFADPYAGGKGNSVRYMSVGERDNHMCAAGMENLFLAGEKSGLFVGHTEAITTGTLAGYNALRKLKGKELLTLPESLAVGDIISYAGKILNEDNGLSRRVTFAGGEYFDRMKDRQLYTTDSRLIKKRVEAEGLLNIYKH